jgi:outer membrane receptor protein involved in Fe transport
MIKNNLLKVFVTAAAFLVLPLTAFAALEEIVVTATKRTESIQDVPVSVSAISADQIETLGITDMEDLSLYIPNFEINSVAVVPNLYMRGMGGGLTHSIEQSVGRFIDDVYISRAVINLHGFMDLANVEVLRGPQGTLFGKNTVGGALILRTADPTDTFEAGVNLGVGDYSTVGGFEEFEGYLSGPLSENLNGRIALRYRDKEGFYENRLDGPNGADRTDYGVRAKLAWTPSDAFSADLKLEYQNFDEYGSDAAEWGGAGGPPLFVYQMHSPQFTPELDWLVDFDCNKDIIANRDTTGDGVADTSVNTGTFCPNRDQTTTNVTLKLEYEAEAGTFTSITAQQDYDYDYQFFGLDMGLAHAFRATRNEDFSGFSQEFRFTSNESDDYDYIVGAYYEDSDLARFQSSDFNLSTVFFDPNGLFLQRNEPWVQATQTLAVFGQVRWHIADNLSMVVGGRWADEDKDFDFERFFDAYASDNRLNIPGGPGGPPLTVSASRSEDKFTGSVSLRWEASDAVMTYGSFSQGHKTGGFSDRIDNPAADFEFDAENVDAWEIGAKMTLLDGDMTMNLALYHMKIEGMQLSTQIPGDVPAFSVDNAADSTSQGLEFETAWSVNDTVTLGANFAYTDASYDSFPGAEVCPPGVTPAANGTCDLAGQSLIFSPEFKGSVYADLVFDDVFGDWDLKAHADVNYSDDAFTDISYGPNTIAPSHTIYNASLRFVSPSQRYSITLQGRNLSDEAYCAWCVPSGPNIIATMNAPREIALRFSAEF